ncbi:MAG: GDSL-type esterase/lipase family protein [Kiritimatiellae bacterium]|nr:GDSL-type esterase/lipase family protein [Kiritimatiellia bacterium]
MKTIVYAVAATAAFVLFAAPAPVAAANSGKSVAAKPADPIEVTAVSHMESRTKDRTRDPGLFGDYWWANRFLSRHQLVEKYQGRTVDVVMLGDSIMHFWEWKHPESWKKFCAGREVLNLGYGGDRTETVIWRIMHGELDGYTAKTIVLMIGTNNNSSDKTEPANVAKGVAKIISLIKEKQPNAKIILHPIFPRGASAESKHHAKARPRCEQTNVLLKEYAAAHPEIVWVDFNDKLVDATGWVPKTLMADEIHPTDQGYDIWMAALAPVLGK